MNSVAPHVEKGTNLKLDQFLIKYGELPSEAEEFEGQEIGESEVWFDQSFFDNFPAGQIPMSSELG